MSKRKHLLTVIGTVVLLFSLAVPIMQCAPAAEEGATPPPEEEGIKYGGRLNIGGLNPLTALKMDTQIKASNWGWLLLMLTYDTYEHYNLPPDYYSFNPRLIQSYETSEDGTVWTWHLAEGATWHDGEPVTAEDIKFNCDYFYGNPMWRDVDNFAIECEIIDESTVRVVNSQRVAASNSPGWWSWIPVVPKHIFEPYKDDITQCPNEEAIGSGPFRLKEFESSQYMLLEAYDDYWGGRPYVDEVLFKYYSNVDTLLMALETGEVDVLESVNIPAFVMEDLEADPNIKTERVPGISFNAMVFNLHKETPLQDKAIRQAILYGIDRDRMIDMVYLGYGEEMDSWLYNEDLMHNPNLPQYEYDPDKANEILDGAGYIDSDGDGIRNDPATGKNLAFELITPAEDVALVKLSQLITEMLPDIGLEIDLATLDYSTFESFIWAPQQDGYEMAVRVMSPGPAPYADWIWLYARGLETGWNMAYYDNPHFNELVDKLFMAPDMETREEYSYEIQAVLSEDLPYAPLVRAQFNSAYRIDKLEVWVNEVGGPVSWMNHWSILKVHLK